MMMMMMMKDDRHDQHGERGCACVCACVHDATSDSQDWLSLSETVGRRRMCVTAIR